MSGFNVSADAVDPEAVPKKKLYTGAEIPGIGLGTFGSDRFTHNEVADSVRGALSVGYRHIDCASVYGNEDRIGQVFKDILAGGLIKRDELWINSKVWNDMHERVEESCRQSLKDLQLDYLDLYLVHWPFPNYHAPGCDITSRSPDAKPYRRENFMDTWRQMESLVDAGLVRHIGTSNMTIPKMQLLLRDCRIRPACNEMELHPHFQQPEFFAYCIDNEIQPIGFCPIGSPTRPDRDKAQSDTVDIQDPVIVRIAQRLNVHPAVVCIKWAVQRGQIPIPFSVYPNEYLSNLRSTVTEPLTDEEMREISKADKNCRLIKGDVFLWKDNQSWEDLWDVDGHITPA
ncbi:2,5-diketo-D-gluconic acid reductase A [Limihaloglobus sulfuriphilus]|uniref:2,5-diketo-D-gluconic acid reductase A n=1 Tax=Limihaloglobus sulfuriphilus TaxID=1851148 RepID=A0A1Q2MBI1_9BACT|nr:aldo/keto reductase [Limihaloglobus sulfuriphilus]AQQ70073.1 2,5-diketo-D-gluconic acid reductase A [Limihaloglobus sulfuriphilus]